MIEFSVRRLQIRDERGARNTRLGQFDRYKRSSGLHARLLHRHTTVQEGEAHQRAVQLRRVQAA